MAIDFDSPRVREVFFDIYDALPRGGPGTTECTLRALDLATPLPVKPRVFDLGCGPGAQTIVLAEALPEAEIIAVDLHQPFLDALDRQVAERGLGARVQTRQGDMADLGLEPASLDLIWSEGAAYMMGLENALRSWRGLLCEGGALALTEATWFRPDPPAPLREMWDAEYPELRDVDGCLDLFMTCGWEVIGHFPLPEEAWLESFYVPMETRLARLADTYACDAVAESVLEESRKEIDIYRHYSDYYGYTFFVARPTDT